MNLVDVRDGQLDDVPVSIVISSFNQDRYLAESIESALGQRGVNVEVIVVDDGSTDASVEIVASYGRSITARTQPNGGQGAAWNTGAALVQGSWTIFLDGDDRLLSDAAASVLAAVHGQPGAAKVHWPMRLIDDNGASLGIRIPQGELPNGDRLAEVIGYGFDRGPNVASSGNAWRTDFLRAVMPLPPAMFRLSPDTFLLGLSPLFGTTVALDVICSEYRCHAGNNGAKGSIGHRAAEVVRRSSFVFDRVAAELDSRGIPADPDRWRAVNPVFQHFLAQVDDAARDSRAPLPPGQPTLSTLDGPTVDRGTDAPTVTRPGNSTAGFTNVNQPPLR